MIGLRIKEERERLGLTQEAISELIGVAKRTFIDWEKDRTSPTAVQLSALSGIGADVLYIVTGTRSTPVKFDNLNNNMNKEKKEWIESFDHVPAERRRTILDVVEVFSQSKPNKNAG